MVAVAVAGRAAARAGPAEESEFHRSTAPYWSGVAVLTGRVRATPIGRI